MGTQTSDAFRLHHKCCETELVLMDSLLVDLFLLRELLYDFLDLLLILILFKDTVDHLSHPILSILF